MQPVHRRQITGGRNLAALFHKTPGVGLNIAFANTLPGGGFDLVRGQGRVGVDHKDPVVEPFRLVIGFGVRDLDRMAERFEQLTSLLDRELALRMQGRVVARPLEHEADAERAGVATDLFGVWPNWRGRGIGVAGHDTLHTIEHTRHVAYRERHHAFIGHPMPALAHAGTKRHPATAGFEPDDAAHAGWNT